MREFTKELRETMKMFPSNSNTALESQNITFEEAMHPHTYSCLVAATFCNLKRKAE